MPTVNRINAVFIYVRNMRAMRNFYEEILGFNHIVVETDMWVEYELPGSHLALHQGDARVLEGHQPLKNTVKFSLEVDDLQTFCEELRELKVEIVFGPRKDFGSLLAEIKDIEGNPIRLVQKL